MRAFSSADGNVDGRVGGGGGGATVAHPPPLIKGYSRVRIQFSSATQLYITLARAAVAAAAIIASR